ncbi:MAG: hypothetical protein COW71_15770 [Ignavibacteriales bacterium CG18_big_fil_WC_8_21_14_2_50_31_20]|nr:MAG: hypothetical protein COW71_15770 [Ignavibacteriales bacterium CG18_big_fil_WC_8_21_14_2_50_31_20]
MKKFVILFTIISLIVLMFSCQLKDNANETNPVNPGTETLVTTSPKSGDTLFVSSSFDIKWTSNTTQKLLIDYTINNGANWNLIAANLDNTQSYIWSSIPNTPTTQGRVRITTADSTLNSISEGFFTIAVGTSKKITLSQPNGGESWKGNSNQAIKWTSINVDSVNIEYTLDNGLNWISIVSNFPSTGFYSWYPLPNTPASNAKVRVIDANDVLVTDLSDGTFSIEPEDLLTVTLPNGGEEWLSGSGQYIKWDTKIDITPGGADLKYTKEKLNIKNSNKKIINNLLLKNNNSKNILLGTPKSIESVEDVKIEYSFNGGASWNTIIETTPNNGIYFWSLVPNVNSTQCLIRVSDAADSVPFDFNDAPFSIFTSLPQEINITAPNGGETWASGTSQIISWNSKDVSLVKIEYTIDNGVNWSTIVESTQSDGFYSWEQIPAIAATNCRVRISDASDGSPSDMSSELFSISPEPNINLISPNGGETLQSGSSINITWNSTNVAKIRIDYTINGGAEWKLIANNVESSGSYTWENIPDVNSNQVKIKISDANDGIPSDISESNLSISNQIVQSLEIVSPNGGEFWEANTAKNISWNSSAVTQVKIEYSSNNGLTWALVENNLLSSGSYDWTVPNVNSTQAKIRISDAVDGNPNDESNATFRIKQAGTLKLINPNSGDNWVAGDLNKIEWEAQNVEKIKIEYTTTNAIYDPTALHFDDQWFNLVTNAPGAAGVFETRFTIPSTEYRLRISDAEFDEPVDFSGLFTVKGQPSYSLQLLTPNGGENWIIGEPYEIAWTSENVERIAIDYSLNNGTTWDNILADAPSNGLFNWVVPDIQDRSDLCKIRIRHATDSTIFDLSDASFSIHPKNKLLRVVSPNGGEDVISGIPTRIEWTSAGVENVDIYFTIDNTTTWHEIIKSYKSTGAYMWTPPDTSSSLARIKVIASNDINIKDESDSYFNIHKANDGTVEVIYPNGGEQLNVGGSTDIKWKTENVKNIKIEYSHNNGADWSTLIASTPTDPGFYEWNPIPSNQTSHGVVRISDASRSDINDISNATFSINDPITIPQVINITSPSGGEKWFVGDSHNIEWTSNNVGNITIEYSVDGNIWKNIVTNVANISPYSWSVPNDKANNVSIRIKEASDNVPTATSQQFSIQTQEITILSPNGGESWAAGEYRNISFTSNNIENIEIEYSVDQGNSWKAIASVSGTTNQYSWNIPNEFSNFVLVRVKDAIDGFPVDVSDAIFEIKPQPTITLISPNGGEIITEGSRKPITWSSKYVQNVRIEFSSNNGGSWQELIANTPSDGSWTWEPVPGIISNLCAIKVSDADRNDISDISENTFSIEEKIDQISGEPASIFLVSQSLNAIGVTESGSPETAQITFEVQDSSGMAIDIAHAVDISFRFGAQPNGGEILAPSVVKTNEKGQVTVNLTSGTIAGAIQVIAEVNFNGNLVSSKPVNIAIHGGMPNLAHFSVGTDKLNYPYLNKIGLTGTVTALVGDKYTNPVRPNTVVYFNSDASVIEGSSLTNPLGLASVKFNSGNPQPNDATYGPGFFYVHANTIDENNANISVNSRVLFSGSPQITVVPLTFAITNGGSQLFTFTVMDENGNPLASGNDYSVSISTAGDAEVSGDIAVKMPDVQTGNTSFSFAVSDSKAAEIKPATATVSITVSGPNGTASTIISGSVE